MRRGFYLGRNYYGNKVMSNSVSNFSDTLLLEQCEAIIKEGLNTLEKVERAFAIIEQMQLYKNGFENFESYSTKRWKVKMNLPHLCQIKIQNNKE